MPKKKIGGVTGAISAGISQGNTKREKARQRSIAEARVRVIRRVAEGGGSESEKKAIRKRALDGNAPMIWYRHVI